MARSGNDSVLEVTMIIGVN